MFDVGEFGEIVKKFMPGARVTVNGNVVEVIGEDGVVFWRVYEVGEDKYYAEALGLFDIIGDGGIAKAVSRYDESIERIEDWGYNVRWYIDDEYIAFWVGVDVFNARSVYDIVYDLIAVDVIGLHL